MIVSKVVLGGPREEWQMGNDRSVVEVALEALLRCLPPVEQAKLRLPRLPGPREAWMREGEAVLLEVAAGTGRSPRAARNLVRAVYVGLATTAPELAARLRAGVSPDVLSLVDGTRMQSAWTRELPLRRRAPRNTTSPRPPGRTRRRKGRAVHHRYRKSLHRRLSAEGSP
ncbi:DUF2267 domain-containing protein [Amycolatopsis jiangsuensis]|uniref:Uncharacterized protein n=1 Tax=Amycolatopsis jiangsuensis TaxID=1181879 RepID=A0A840ISK0_9PSEU|nr:DUF2267 domain-containing protein [Amycolatopsis jiangsuensis]MBB4683974.1 hypothetical protein [Amycolatopsis jiangsuensis]